MKEKKMVLIKKIPTGFLGIALATGTLLAASPQTSTNASAGEPGAVIDSVEVAVSADGQTVRILGTRGLQDGVLIVLGLNKDSGTITDAVKAIQEGDVLDFQISEHNAGNYSAAFQELGKKFDRVALVTADNVTGTFDLAIVAPLSATLPGTRSAAIQAPIPSFSKAIGPDLLVSVMFVQGPLTKSCDPTGTPLVDISCMWGVRGVKVNAVVANFGTVAVPGGTTHVGWGLTQQVKHSAPYAPWNCNGVGFNQIEGIQSTIPAMGPTGPGFVIKSRPFYAGPCDVTTCGDGIPGYKKVVCFVAFADPLNTVAESNEFNNGVTLSPLLCDHCDGGGGTQLGFGEVEVMNTHLPHGQLSSN